MKQTQALIVAFAALLIGAGYYFELHLGLNPCPLCIIQRAEIFIVGLLFLIGIFIPYRKSILLRIIHGLAFFVSLTGIATSARQLYLQSLPADQVPACGPGLSYMVSNLPINQTIKLLFQGSGSCAEVQWTFLSFSMPAWTISAFVVFTITAGYLLFSKR